VTRQDAALPAAGLAGTGQVPASCPHLRAWCGAHAGLARRQSVPALSRAAGRERTAGELHHDATLAAGMLAEQSP
jgi:hypothetical protein